METVRTKTDLIIEAWERLDCESIGRKEIEAIEVAVRERFGPQAVDPVMVIARLLADEGAELRHAELMDLHIERDEDRPYDAAFRDLFDFTGLESARSSLRRMENLRKKFTERKDREGLRLLRQLAIEEKDDLISSSGSRLRPLPEAVRKEIAEWLTIWLGSPEVFEAWIEMRQSSADYAERFLER